MLSPPNHVENRKRSGQSSGAAAAGPSVRFYGGWAFTSAGSHPTFCMAIALYCQCYGLIIIIVYLFIVVHKHFLNSL
jgi:hypothetical protein